MDKKHIENIIGDFNRAFETRFQNVHQNFAVVLKFCKKHFRYNEKLYYGLKQEIKTNNFLNIHHANCIDHRVNQTHSAFGQLT